MNFDAGEILSHAWQITWRHKILWAFAALPMFPVLVFLPLLLYIFLSVDFTKGVPDRFEQPNSVLVFLAVTILLAAISLVLRVFSNAAIAFGIYQVEAGKSGLNFAETLQGGQACFWRILIVMLLAALAMMSFFAVFSACLSVVGILTFGLGSAVGQLLTVPITLLFSVLVEQAQAAIVADAMRPTDAISRAWNLLKVHTGEYAFLAFLLYFGLAILNGIVILPVILPALLGILGRFTYALSSPPITWTAMSCFTVLLPLYLLLQAVAMLYMKSIYMTVYLRLSRSGKLQSLPASLEATP